MPPSGMPSRHVLFAAVASAAVMTSPGLARAEEDVAALIKRQSQEFSDASASGDAEVLGRYLDDRVVFMNETGAIAAKAEYRDIRSAPSR